LLAVVGGDAGEPPMTEALRSDRRSLNLAMAHDVALGVVSLTEESLPPESLTLPLGLSLWMRQHGAGLEDLIEAIVAVRAGVIESAGLDQATEPVPLPVYDSRVMVLNLVAYLADLVSRAASMKGTSRREVIGRALAHMGA
jgi:hypothetical protein